MAAVKEYSPEELNYFRAMYVTTRIIPDSLRTVFKQEWDNRYQATPYGTWQDKAKNGIDFYNMESPRSRKIKHRELAVIRNGNTCEWDCTCLFYAILFSDSVGKGLDPAVKKSVDDLRLFRNDCVHKWKGKLNESDFNSNIKKVITAFASLNLSTAGIEDIRIQRTFPTQELRDLMEQLEKEKMRNEEPQPFCVLPTQPSHQVIDRPHEIRQIQAQMERLRSTNQNEITIIYLSGNPGCGKSEIARQVGEKAFEDTSVHATEIKFVFTLNASSLDTLIQSYVEFAISLKCDENSVTSIVTSKDLSQEDKLMHLKCHVAPKLRKYSSWLIIVDNVTDVKSVLRYLPQAGEKTEGKGQMLVTTQDSRSIPPDKSYTYHLSLSKGMKRNEAFRMLSEISDIEDEEETTFEIVKALDFQPLALACAATYMKRVRITKPTFSWEEYGEKLKQGKRQATEGEYKRISAAYSLPMTAAVRLAVQKEMDEEGFMKHAFHFLSVMASEPIPLEYVVQYVTRLLPDEDEELVAAHISSSSLILSSENQLKEIGVHQVVHSCLQNLFLHQNKFEECHFLINVIKAFSKLLNSFQEDNIDHIVATKSIVVHFIEVSKKLNFHETNLQLIPEKQIRQNDRSIRQNDQFIRCLSKMGNICNIHGKHEAQHCFHKITFMIIENTKCYENHPTFATTLNNLGLGYRDLGQHKEALKCFERALAIQEKAYDADHPTLATTLNKLGLSYRDLGQHKEALKCLERALAIGEKAYDADHPALATTLNNLGLGYRDLGQHKEELKCFERALAIGEKAYDQDHPTMATALNNLGLSYRDLGQHKEELKCFERALAIGEKAYDQGYPTLATALSNLGVTYRDLGQHKEALKCLERALTIQEKAYDADHPTMATALNNLGLSYRDLGQHKEALKCFERALAIGEKAYDAGYPTLATALSNLGVTYRDLGQHKEALKCLERALTIQEKAYDQDHPTLATTLSNLEICYRDLGQHKEALKCFERALAIEEKAYDADHPYLATTLNNLGLIFRELRQHKEALKYVERAFAIQEKAYDADHPTLATALNKLGLGYRDLGQHKEAKKCLKRALAVQEKTYDRDHPTLAITLNNLGVSYRDLGEHKKAQKSFERALAIQEKAYDQDHPNLATALSNLGLSYCDLGQHKEELKCFERALAIQEKAYDSDHLTLATTLNNLGVSYFYLGQQKEAQNCFERALAIEEKA